MLQRSPKETPIWELSVAHSMAIWPIAVMSSCLGVQKTDQKASPSSTAANVWKWPLRPDECPMCIGLISWDDDTDRGLKKWTGFWSALLFYCLCQCRNAVCCSSIHKIWAFFHSVNCIVCLLWRARDITLSHNHCIPNSLQIFLVHHCFIISIASGCRDSHSM